MPNFNSKFALGDFVEFLERRTHKKTKKGWILQICFSEDLVLYVIQGENNKKGCCYCYESIEEDQIIRITEM